MYFTLKAVIKNRALLVIILPLLSSRIIFFNNDEDRFIHVDSKSQKIVIEERRDFRDIVIFSFNMI